MLQTPIVADTEIETGFLHLLGVDDLTSDPVFRKDEHISSISPQKGMSSLECEAEDPSKMKDQPAYIPQQSPLPHSPVEPTTTEVQLLSRRVADLERLLADFMCSSGGGEKGVYTAVADSPNKAGIVDAALTIKNDPMPHMDALIGLLLFNAAKEPGHFGDGWTTMEMFCRGALEQSNFQTVHDRGLVSKVFGVGHINGNHWGVMRWHWMSNELQFITLYPDLKKEKLLYDECKVWEMKGLTDGLRREFEVVSYERPTQQKTLDDCGIMSIKYMECLISHFDVRDLDAGRCGVFHHSYCGKLHEIGEEASVIE
ncbi:hypothetical protein C2S52_019670 [Perilla frutescens var. hirtella]|nr:hypothetical protein C2S52_019670 [Perilla frutescens var. hirtella]